MDAAARQFGWYLLFWIVYFMIVYSALTFVYLKQRENPPGASAGRRDAAAGAWEARDRELRKRLVRIGFGLMLAPLLLPFLLKWIR